MKRLLALITSLLFIGNVYAAELKVGVINLDEVLQKSPMAVQLNAKISSDFKPRQDKLNAAQASLQTTLDDFTYNSYKMTPEERNKMQVKINADRRALENMSTSLQRDLQTAQQQGVQSLLNKLNTVIAQIAKDGNYDMILSTANTLYLNPTINITQQVVDQVK